MMTVSEAEEISLRVCPTTGRSLNSTSSRNYYVDSTIDFTSGTLGGFANCLVAQPFDTVKVKLQTFPGDYRSATHCFLKTFRRDGVLRGLYAGIAPAMVAHVAENAVLFTFYGLCQKTVMNLLHVDDRESLSVVQNGMAGSGASIFSSIVLCPTELVKCRLQAYREMVDSGRMATSPAYRGTWSLCRHIFRTDGFRGFYRGFTGTVIREIPGYFGFFGGYELARTCFTPEGKTKSEIGPVKTMISGGCGGCALWCIIYPIDCIKSRQQVYSQVKPTSFFATAAAIMRTEGFLSLYRGLAPTIVRTFLATGVLFFTVENTKQFLKFESEKFL